MRVFAVCIQFLLSFALTGCSASPEPGVMHGDVAFTPVQRLEIEAGNAWIADRLERKPLTIVWDLASPVTLADAPENSIMLASRPFAHAGYVKPGYRMYLDPNWPLTPLSAHEFGHVYGCSGDHHPGPGIMNAELEGMMWTRADERVCP